MVPVRALSFAVSLQCMGPGPEAAMGELGGRERRSVRRAGAAGHEACAPARPRVPQLWALFAEPGAAHRFGEAFSHLPESGHDIYEARKLFMPSKAVLEKFHAVPCL